jgi:hypothetical protein
LIEAIHFVLIGGGWTQVCVALLDNHVAGGARAASPAGVLDMHAEIDGDI